MSLPTTLVPKLASPLAHPLAPLAAKTGRKAMAQWRHTPGYMATSARLALYDVIRDPAALKKEGFMVATIIQSLIRGIISWLNESLTKDPEQKELRFREAIRTTLREVGGLSLNFGVLRLIEHLTNTMLDKLQGGQYHGQKPVIGFARLKQDWQAFKLAKQQQTALPGLSPNTLDALEKSVSWSFNMNSPLGRWFTRQCENGLFKGQSPQRLMNLTRNWLPISLGSIAAVGLSGFWLEWMTIHKAEPILAFCTKHFAPKPVAKNKKKTDKSPSYNVNEFVSGVLEERWRRQQVDPLFGKHKKQP
jgi:hypothetical protein